MTWSHLSSLPPRLLGCGPSRRSPQNSPANSNLAPPWQPGQSGNPAGRPRGSRSRLSESFLCDFLAVWEEEGLDAIRGCARNDPSTFVRVAASLLRTI